MPFTGRQVQVIPNNAYFYGNDVFPIVNQIPAGAATPPDSFDIVTFVSGGLQGALVAAVPTAGSMHAVAGFRLDVVARIEGVVGQLEFLWGTRQFVTAGATTADFATMPNFPNVLVPDGVQFTSVADIAIPCRFFQVLLRNLDAVNPSTRWDLTITVRGNSN